MNESISSSTAWLGRILITATVLLLLAAIALLVTYPSRARDARVKFEAAVDDGYIAVYEGENVTELGFDVLYNKYSFTYLPTQKRILLEKHFQYRGDHTYLPIIIH